ncbi:MAG TPA: TRAP transporter small permease [Burkholderiaceae bacterium]
MKALTALCNRLSQLTLALASVALAGLGLIVIFGVVMRYAFNAQPACVEQVALLLVICVAMFGASVGVHGAGHIGLDSAVKLLPPRGQWLCGLLSDFLVLSFAAVLVYGSVEMMDATQGNTIPTLGIAEAWRYAPPLLSGVLVALFSIERLLSALLPAEAPQHASRAAH